MRAALTTCVCGKSTALGHREAFEAGWRSWGAHYVCPECSVLANKNPMGYAVAAYGKKAVNDALRGKD